MSAQVKQIPRRRAATMMPAKGSGQSVTSRQHTAPAAVRVTIEQAKDPTELARVLTDIQSAINASSKGSRTNPLNANPVRFPGVSFTSGQAKLLVHNLGRAPLGVIVTDPGTAGITVKRAALPTGYTSAVAVSLIPSATGAADVMVL